MSKRVIFVCTALLLLGLLAAWEILSAMLGGRISINFGVLFIPISMGLFLGKSVARTAANVVFSLTYVLLLAVLVMSLMAGNTVIQVFGASIPFQGAFAVIGVAVALIGSCCGLLHWLLYSPPFDEHLS